MHTNQFWNWVSYLQTMSLLIFFTMLWTLLAEQAMQWLKSDSSFGRFHPAQLSFWILCLKLITKTEWIPWNLALKWPWYSCSNFIHWKPQCKLQPYRISLEFPCTCNVVNAPEYWCVEPISDHSLPNLLALNSTRTFGIFHFVPEIFVSVVGWYSMKWIRWTI